MKLKNLSITFLFIIFTLAACGSQNITTPVAETLISSGEAVIETPVEVDSTPLPNIVVTDALGRTVTFENPPQRIVLAGRSLFMIADAIYMFPDAISRIAAISVTNQGSGNFIPLIDPSYDSKIVLELEPSTEEIVALQPDCVIMKSFNATTLGAPIEALGIPVVYLDFETPEQYQRDLVTLGQLFQNPDRANELIEFFNNRVAQVTEITSDLSDTEKPRTLLLYYSTKGDAVSFNVPPVSWIQTMMVEMSGGIPVWKDANLGNGWTQVNLEQVAAWNPEMIIIVSYLNPVNEVVDLLKADPQWQGLDAVKNGKIYGFATDAYSWDQPDPRWILGLTWLSGKLHPDLFPNLDIESEAQTFYRELYGINESVFTNTMLPLLTGDWR